MGTVTSVGSGNWEAGATWDSGSRAGNADDVIIASGHNVTVVQGEQANSLTVASGGTLTVTGSRTITIDSENDPSVGAYAVNLDGAIAHTDGSSNISLTITTPATTNVDIFPTLIEGSMAFAGKSSWVYICNNSEDETEYAIITISGNVIGKLYAGDFLWMPWSMAEDADSDNKHADIQLTPSVATGMWFSWCMINEGTEYPTSV